MSSDQKSPGAADLQAARNKLALLRSANAGKILLRSLEAIKNDGVTEESVNAAYNVGDNAMQSAPGSSTALWQVAYDVKQTLSLGASALSEAKRDGLPTKPAEDLILAAVEAAIEAVKSANFVTGFEDGANHDTITLIVRG